MIHTDEDDEFSRIEHENQIRKQRMFEHTFHQVVRNQTLEEVAKEFESMRIAFGDTAASFAQYVREMKV
jgi:hypothetical protein